MGSTFWFTTVRLKKKINRKNTAPQFSLEDPGSLIRLHHLGSRILVVDDEAINLLLNCSWRGLAVSVDVAQDGLEAVQKQAMIPTQSF